MHTMVCMWKSESNLQELVLSLHYNEFLGNELKFVGLGGKCHSLLTEPFCQSSMLFSGGNVLSKVYHINTNLFYHNNFKVKLKSNRKLTSKGKKIRKITKDKLWNNINVHKRLGEKRLEK